VKQWSERYDRHRLEALERYAALIADGVRLGLNQESLARAYPPPAPVLETMTVLGRQSPSSLSTVDGFENMVSMKICFYCSSQTRFSFLLR